MKSEWIAVLVYGSEGYGRARSEVIMEGQYSDIYARAFPSLAAARKEAQGTAKDPTEDVRRIIYLKTTRKPSIVVEDISREDVTIRPVTKIEVKNV